MLKSNDLVGGFTCSNQFMGMPYHNYSFIFSFSVQFLHGIISNWLPMFVTLSQVNTGSPSCFHVRGAGGGGGGGRQRAVKADIFNASEVLGLNQQIAPLGAISPDTCH